MNMSPYRLRCAVGMGWIIKENQQEAEYVAPITINECGILVWKGLEEGLLIDELVKMVEQHYSIDHNEAFEDVNAFLKQLSFLGIEIKYI